MKRMMMLTAAIALMGTAAAATIDSDALIRDLSSQGFTRVVVKRGPTQVMVQAIRGQEKLDLVLDNDTGTVLTQHMGKVWFYDNTAPGFYVADRNRDFLTQPATQVARNADGPAILPDHAGGAVAATAGLAIRVDEGYDGVAVDEMPAEGDPINIDGIGDGLPLGDEQAPDGDVDMIWIDDGIWYEGDGIIDDGTGGDGTGGDGTGGDGTDGDGTGGDGTGGDGTDGDGTGGDGTDGDGTGGDGTGDDGTGGDGTDGDGTGGDGTGGDGTGGDGTGGDDTGGDGTGGDDTGGDGTGGDDTGGDGTGGGDISIQPAELGAPTESP